MSTSVFGARLRQCRRAAGLTQEDLAERSGLSVRAISNLERGHTGRPYRATAGLLAKALGLDDTASGQFIDAARAGHLLDDPAGLPHRGQDAGPAGRPAGIGQLRLVPQQLPAGLAYFTGREVELQALTRMLGDGAQDAGTVVILAIDGTAGIGKTTLAVRWAHQVADRFPDGQLFVNLRGFDPAGAPVASAKAMRGFLDALAVPAQRIPAAPEEQAALYRSVLAGKRMLIVLDNARSAAQVRPLLPGSPGCLVLVTSRRQLFGLAVADGAHMLTLGLLTDTEARDLLARRVGPELVLAEHEAADELIRLCARLPLALSIAATCAVARPGMPLGALAAELADARARLDALGTGDSATDVRAVFSWSYRQLTAPLARMFRLLSTHPGPDISAPAAASLGAIPLAQAGLALRELARAHLLTEHSQGRYAFHDLLRAYAAERSDDCATERSAALHRMLDHYLYTAFAADRLLNPARDPITLAVRQAGVIPEQLTEHGQAMAWFQAEHKVLLAAVTLAVGAGFDTHAWQIPWALVDFLERRGYWTDWIATQRTALAATRRRGDRAGQARACRGLGYACARMGLDEDAARYLSEALRLFRQVGDPVGEARTHQDFSWMLDRQGRPDQALRHDELALRVYQEAGHLTGQANALNAIGWLHAVLGAYRKAHDYCGQALALHSELGNRRGQAATWDSLGFAHHHLGQHTEAVTCYQRSLSLFRELADRDNEAEILTHLGDTQHAVGNSSAARDAWQQAFAILDDLRHPKADEVRAKLSDHPAHQAGHPAL
jgi:transcriptional regulator with XRE-family HTH domain/tetratricopeptide (TPR) repeat protein